MTEYVVDLYVQFMPDKPETVFLWQSQLEAPSGNAAIDLAESACMNRIRERFGYTSDSAVPVSVVGCDVWESGDEPYHRGEPRRPEAVIEQLRERNKTLRGMLKKNGVDGLLEEVESLRAQLDTGGKLREAAYLAWSALDAEFHGDV